VLRDRSTALLAISSSRIGIITSVCMVYGIALQVEVVRVFDFRIAAEHRHRGRRCVDDAIAIEAQIVT
jgi:hypothetical protein